ncbi:MAG: hypothetical protein Q9174_006338, partial [Haloplaca sp. 1 TL-2023]
GDRQLTQARGSPQPAYPNSQSLTTYQPPSPGWDDRRPSSRDERYLYADEDRERRHRRSSRSRRSHRSRSGSRSRSRSRDLGSALIGAAGGGFIGHKYGGGALGAIGGAVAGAVASNLAEKEWEKQKEKRERKRERGEDTDKGVVGTLLHPDRAIQRARSRVRDGSDDEYEDGGRRRHRHRHDKGSRSLSRGYYEEEYEQRRSIALIDSIIERRISELERFLHSIDMGGSSDGFATVAGEFFALRESTSANGQGFAYRMDKIHRVAKRLGAYRVDLEGLSDFSLRQKTAALDGDLQGIRQRMLEYKDTEEGEIKEESHDQPTATDRMTPDLPTDIHFYPSSPRSIDILSVVTNARMAVAKDHSQPFRLVFNSYTQTYGFHEFECEHTDFDIGDKTTRLLHTLDPERLGYVAWSPGMLFVHTHTKDYERSKKRVLSGGYCNLGVVDIEGLERLVEHLKERPVVVER